MAAGFEEGDGRGGGEVETAGGRMHWDREAVVWVGGEQGFGQPSGFAAKDEVITRFKCLIPIGLTAFSSEEKEPGMRGSGGAGLSDGLGSQRVEGFPEPPIEVFPIIEAGTGQGAIVDAKPERFDQVEAGAGGDAEASDGPGIGGDFGGDEDDVEDG